MKNVSVLFYNQLLSTFASTFGTFWISWIVYAETGSKLAMGGVWLVSIAGQLLIQFLAGPYIDRYLRTTMMKASESIRFSAFFLLWLTLITDHFELEFLYLTAFLTSITVYDPAAAALVPKLVKNDEFVKVNAKLSGGVQLMRFIALPASGLILTAVHNQEALLCISMMFLISYLMIMKIKEPSIARVKQNSWLIQFREGIHIYRKHLILLVLGCFITVTSFGVFATQTMYIPYIVETIGGSTLEYGFFAAAFPLGYILGSYAAAKIREPKQSLYLVMTSAIFLGGCTFFALGVISDLWIAILIEVIAGTVMPFWNIYSTTLYQRLVPDSILGQVLSIRFLLTKAAAPLGIMYGTFCAAQFGIPALFLSVGLLICTVSGVGLAILTSLKKRNMVQRSL
ncbi:MFS transporter [Metabacillus idriensis]|uniref:MFS transporter n=1 Tax=Metabacillus idriensis TaxID=324768 RepID=UPI00174CF415|nr:MFS transporter [Metabacillus idriensis]